MNTRMPIPCAGGLQYGNRYFRCWEPRGHGDLTLSQAIAQSCDVYFYQLGLKLGLTSLLEDVNALGFRSRTGIDLPGEITPEFPGGTEYYDRVYGPRHWTSAVTLNLAIGQGENAQSLIDMVRLYQMLASDGKSRVPYVVHPQATHTEDLDLSQDQIDGLRRAMVGVLQEGGTARAARLGDITIAGKTGTAQNPHGPNHGWFIAFAPAEKPQIVVGAIVEFAREGPYVAPLVTRVIARYLGVDSTLASNATFRLPADSAPHEVRTLPPAPSRRRSILRPNRILSSSPTRPTMAGRVQGLDRSLVAVTLALCVYGLATLYSAGQTDVPTVATHIWHKQIIWLALGVGAAAFTFRLSPRMVEWATRTSTASSRSC